MTGKIVIYASVFVAVVLVYGGWKFTARGAYESAQYDVLKTDRPFEVREYPDLIVAATNMRFESQGDDGSFMRLFRYISGSNDDQQKVAMTTPVFMEPKSDDAQGQMGFVVPKQVVEQGVPKPSDDSVRIRKRSGGRFAVIRFAGRSNRDSITKAEERLRAWMKVEGLTADGNAEFAGYDPPWTPGPLRRNEVLIRLKELDRIEEIDD